MNTRTLITLAAATVTAISLAVAGTASALVTNPGQVYRIANLTVTSTTSTSATIKNNGTLGSGPFVVHVSTGYVGDQCHWYVYPIVRSVTSLAAGASTTIRFTGGEYASESNRRVTADYGNQVMEANENDNFGTIPGTDIVC
jgi:hypothetical protein